MKKVNPTNRKTRRARWAGLGTLIAAFWLVLPLGYAERPGDRGGRGDDDITTLPSELDASLLPSLGLVGPISEIDGIVRKITGTGRLRVQSLDDLGLPGFAAVQFLGDLDVELDLAALASSSVSAWFSGGPLFVGGQAIVQVGATFSAPFQIPPAFLEEIPLGAIGEMAQDVVLWALSPDQALFGLRFSPTGGRRLLVSQRAFL